MIHRPLAVALVAAAALALGACTHGPVFHILADPDQKPLEPIVQAFCKAHGRRCEISYVPSLDIAQAVSGAQGADADAVWPASSLWLQLFDRQRRVTDIRSIARAPVILAVRTGKAQALGWRQDASVPTAAVVEAVRGGRLSLLLTAPSRSGDGALGWLSMLPPTGPDDGAERAIAAAAALSGATGSTADAYLREASAGRSFDGVWITEAGLKVLNAGLLQKGLEPLVALRPAEGAAFADAPLGYEDRGQDDDTHAFFRDLQAHLLSAEVQSRLAAGGWRIAPGRDAAPALRALPEGPAILAALTRYQRITHPPTLTAFCLDVSNASAGAQMKSALRSMLAPGPAGETLMPWSVRDRIIVIPFDDQPREALDGDGTPASRARLIAGAESQGTAGGGDMYACAAKAFELMAPYAQTGPLRAAVVVLAAGRSSQSPQFESQWRAEGGGAPVFGVSFGDEGRESLDDLARLTRGRVFAGRAGAADAVRTARGYD